MVGGASAVGGVLSGEAPTLEYDVMLAKHWFGVLCCSTWMLLFCEGGVFIGRIFASFFLGVLFVLEVTLLLFVVPLEFLLLLLPLLVPVLCLLLDPCIHPSGSLP